MALTIVTCPEGKVGGGEARGYEIEMAYLSVT